MEKIYSKTIELMGFPILASKHGEDVDYFIVYVHALMAVLFAGWVGYFLYALWRFRASNHPKADYVGLRSQATNYIEIAVAVVEVVLLVGFAVPLWAKVVDKFPEPKDATQIRVTAQQFAWNSRYPGKDGAFAEQSPKYVSAGNIQGYNTNSPANADDFTPPLNEMCVPLINLETDASKPPSYKPVIVYLSSMDVIHSFKIYPLRVNQDAIPGMMIPIHFIPTKEGKFQIVCAQLCGNSHYAMKGYFNVLKPDDYDKWVAEKSKGGGAPVSFE